MEFPTVDGPNQNWPLSDADPTTLIRLFRRSVAGLNFLHLILSGRLWVGHKSDLDRPVDTPSLLHWANMSNIFLTPSLKLKTEARWRLVDG